ncbi:hypothetical protein BN2475_420113 [Paraburkholderia ribeironis]|uniref:Uncharacterized protein n=1 Tax=Paraburkholderia ribeironis TaxID=1247936 RepID=A0A1N7S7Y9_9BURK|nr:hypothetical protein BN2475_420113 [Paraburkholderia ribeironis]
MTDGLHSAQCGARHPRHCSEALGDRLHHFTGRTRERDREIGAFVLLIGGDRNAFDIPRDWHEYLPNGGNPHFVKIRANVETLAVGRRHLRVGCHSFYSPNFSIAFSCCSPVRVAPPRLATRELRRRPFRGYGAYHQSR